MKKFGMFFWEFEFFEFDLQESKKKLSQEDLYRNHASGLLLLYLARICFHCTNEREWIYIYIYIYLTPGVNFLFKMLRIELILYIASKICQVVNFKLSMSLFVMCMSLLFNAPNNLSFLSHCRTHDLWGWTYSWFCKLVLWHLCRHCWEVLID